MAQFDVYRRSDGPGYLLDCQSDLLSGLSHRLTVPLLPVDFAPLAARRLNPSFLVEGQEVRMMAQFTAAVPKHELREPIASLDSHHVEIITAIDMLIGGY